MSGRGSLGVMASPTCRAGLEPTGLWTQRIPSLQANPNLKNASWFFGFEKRPLYSTDEAVQLVLETIWPKRERLLSYLSTHDATTVMTCSVTILVDRPVYELSAGTMGKLHELRCEFLLDIFDYS